MENFTSCIKTKSIRMILSIVALVILSNQSLGQTVFYVDTDATGQANGSSWTDAFLQLSSALFFAQAGDEIWIAQGTYPPETEGTTYTLPSGVGIFGGFAGNETSRSQADPASNPVIFDGSLGNFGHIFTLTNSSPTTTIQGITVTSAVAGDDTIGGIGGAGAVMLITNGSPLIKDCIFTSNSARLGSVAMVIDSGPTFQSCFFGSNFSTRSGEGGAIYSHITIPNTQQLLSIADSTFDANFVMQGHWATGNGGAVYGGTGVSIEITGCIFDRNAGYHNMTYGNAVKGGAIFSDGPIVIKDSIISRSYSALGAGVYAGTSIVCQNTIFTGNRAVWNGCTGPECGDTNTGSGYGGGIYIQYGAANLTSCIFAGNWAVKTGGGAYMNGTITNSIFWANESAPVEPGEDPVLTLRKQINGNGFGTIDITYCNIQGLFEQIPGEDPVDPANFPGTLDQDPGFTVMPVVFVGNGILATHGEFHFLPNSPSIDAGNNTVVPVDMTLDLDGLPRFFDDPATADTGVGPAPIVDMGVYEYGSSLPSCVVDINNDGNVDVLDFFAFIVAFNSGDPLADLDASGTIDVLDFFTFITLFSAGC